MEYSGEALQSQTTGRDTVQTVHPQSLPADCSLQNITKSDYEFWNNAFLAICKDNVEYS